MLLRSRQLRRSILLIIDLATLLLSFTISWMFRFGNIHTWTYQELYRTTMVVMVLMYILVFLFHDSKRPPVMSQGVFDTMLSVFMNQALMTAFLFVYFFATQQGTLVSRYVIGMTVAINLAINFISRMIYVAFLRNCTGNEDNMTNVMLVALADDAPRILHRMKDNVNFTRVSCITILDEDLIGTKIDGVPVVGNRVNYLETHRHYVFDEVFIHLPYDYHFPLRNLILGFEQMGITVNLNVEVFNIDAREKQIRKFGGYQVISFSAVNLNTGGLVIKRFIDIIGSLVGLMICGIALLIFGPIIHFTSEGPIFFAQTRVGINGRRFQIYKLRTMYQDAEERKKELMAKNEMNGLMFKMKDDPRITPIGKFLRKTSIDELPQFWNVLKGDMSLVGTRPPTVDEYEQYGSYHMRRLSIRPGITGMWQVSGRSNITDFEDVVRLDLQYIDNWSVLLDFKLLCMTVWTVVFGKGAS